MKIKDLKTKSTDQLYRIMSCIITDIARSHIVRDMSAHRRDYREIETEIDYREYAGGRV